MSRRRLGLLASALLAIGGRAEAVETSPAGDAAQSDTQVHTRSAPPAGEPQEEKEGPAVDLSVVYTFDLWRNERGGVEQGERFLDNLDVTLTVDAERALGWDGATIFLYGLYNNGKSLSDDLVGDLQVASNLDAGVQAVRLYEAWIEQRFARDGASVKVGLYDLNSEFDTNDSGALFINSSHGIGPDLSQSGQNGPSIFPVTSLAMRADYRIHENWLIRTAVLDGVPGNPARPKRTAIKLGDGDGALLVAELEYTDAMTKAAIGTWRYTSKFDELLATPSGAGRSRSAGLYAFAERKLTGLSREGPVLSGWARAGIADEDVNPFKNYVGGGFVYTGLVPGRAEDQFGLGIASVGLGRPYRAALAREGLPSDERETNIELTYRAAITPWLTLQPDVQYVIDPGADPALENALLLGLRVEIGF